MQIRREEAHDEVVDVLEPRGHPLLGRPLLAAHDAVEALADDLFDGHELAGAALLGDGEQPLLGSVEQLDDVVRTLVAHLGDLVADLDEAPEGALLPDDVGVVPGSRGGRDGLRESVDEVAAADPLQGALTLELGADRDDVDLAAGRVEPPDGVEHDAVALAPEIVANEHVARDGDGIRVDEHGTEDRLFRLRVLGRHAGFDRCGLLGSHGRLRPPVRQGADSLRDDEDLHGRDEALGDFHVDHEAAHLLDRLLEKDVALVDALAAGLEDRVGDVGVGHRAEQPVFLADARLHGDDGAIEGVGDLLRLGGEASLPGLPLLLATAELDQLAR